MYLIGLKRGSFDGSHRLSFKYLSKQISKKGKGAIISVKVTKREGVNYYSKLRAG